MFVSDFDFELPEHLIACYPAAERTGSRLLRLNRKTGELQDDAFKNLLSFLQPGDCLVVNESKVMPALLWGKKETGGQVECLIERILDNGEALAHVKASKSPKQGQELYFEAGLVLQVIEKSETGLFRLRYQGIPDLCRYLMEYGSMPLPPYMERKAEASDRERYQTVYSQTLGSVAAPTAGLHFDQALLEQIQHKGVRVAKVTLHVGAGTFQPVRVDALQDHKMHSEWISIDQETCDVIQGAKNRGGRVIAVGTTSVRVLESVMQKKGALVPYAGETAIFIYPGFQFQMVEALITNFHLPKSTLLMLVSAFAGREAILRAYTHAIAHHYRFYSYGDAMLIS